MLIFPCSKLKNIRLQLLYLILIVDIRKTVAETENPNPWNAVMPEITYGSHEAVMETVRFNKTFFTHISNKSFNLIAECTAGYPVKWDTKTRKVKSEIFPTKEKVLGLSTSMNEYVFKAILEISVNADVLRENETVHYICGSRSGRCIKNDLYIRSPRKNANAVLVNSNTHSRSIQKAKECELRNKYVDDVSLNPAEPLTPRKTGKTAVPPCADILTINYVISVLKSSPIAGKISCWTHEEHLSDHVVIAYKQMGRPDIQLFDDKEMYRSYGSSTHYKTNVNIKGSPPLQIDSVYCFSALLNSYRWCNDSLQIRRTGSIK